MPSLSLHKLSTTTIAAQSSTGKLPAPAKPTAPGSAVNVDFLTLFTALDQQLAAGTKGREALQDVVRKFVSEIVDRLVRFCEAPVTVGVGAIPIIVEEQEEDEFVAKPEVTTERTITDIPPIDPAMATSDSTILVSIFQRFGSIVLSDGDLLAVRPSLISNRVAC